MPEKCSFCERRQGLLSTEVATLHVLGDDATCSSCMKMLALIATKLVVPDARGVAALATRNLSKSSTLANAEAVRAEALASVFFPDLTTAVESFLHVLEQEESKPSSKRNAENIAAARAGLQALIHTKHTKTARLFVERARGSKTNPAADGR